MLASKVGDGASCSRDKMSCEIYNNWYLRNPEKVRCSEKRNVVS